MPTDEPTAVTAGADLLELVLAATLEGMVDCNLVTNEARYNARWKTLLGYDVHELEDSSGLWRQFLHPEDRAGVEAAVRDHLESYWPLDRLTRMRHKEGGWRWIHLRGGAIRDGQGNAVRLIALFQDVTDRVLADERHRAMATALQSAGEGIYGLGADGNITFVNSAACTMLGWTSDDLVGKHGHEICHPGLIEGKATNDAAVPCPVFATLRDGSENRVTTADLCRKNGSHFPAEYVAAPIREGGTITGTVVAFRDLTERRALELQLLQAQKLESIGQLAAGIAHEINTPMQFIGDNIYFLKQAFDDLMRLVAVSRDIVATAWPDGIPAPTAEAMAAAETEADLVFLRDAVPAALARSSDGIGTVSTIVRAMKAFSHPGGGGKALNDINLAIQNTLTVARNEWKYIADMETDLATDLPMVPCHLGEMNQVFLNIIVNAAHAIADSIALGKYLKGKIAIHTASRGDFVEIRIADSGQGIPESIRHRVFDHFFTTKGVGKGSGQGLSIARSIVVKKHAGTIDFESVPGKGTTFVIRLPLRIPTEAAIESTAP